MRKQHVVLCLLLTAAMLVVGTNAYAQWVRQPQGEMGENLAWTPATLYWAYPTPYDLLERPEVYVASVLSVPASACLTFAAELKAYAYLELGLWDPYDESATSQAQIGYGGQKEAVAEFSMEWTDEENDPPPTSFDLYINIKYTAVAEGYATNSTWFTPAYTEGRAQFQINVNTHPADMASGEYITDVHGSKESSTSFEGIALVISPRPEVQIDWAFPISEYWLGGVSNLQKAHTGVVNNALGSAFVPEVTCVVRMKTRADAISREDAMFSGAAATIGINNTLLRIP